MQLKKLRAVGPLGSLLANLITFLTTNWAVVVSAILAFVTGAFEWAQGFALRPSVQAGAGTFLFFLWTFIGVLVIAKWKSPTLVKVLQDFEHSLIIETLTPNYDPTSNDFAFAINLQIRNVGAGPIRVKIEEYRVTIEDRTIPENDIPVFILPRLAPRTIRSAGFKKEAIQGKVKGKVRFVFLYGDPKETSFMRRLICKTDINIETIENNIRFGDENMTMEEEKI